MKLNPITWWRWRQMRISDDRYWVGHIAETDVKDNQRLAESYKQHPLRLVAVVVADIFMDTDIDKLARSIDPRLKAPGHDQRKHRAQVCDMLRRARSKAGGREGLGAIHFARSGEGRKYLGGAHEIRLPPGVERVGLLLYQFAPGMVMAASVAGAAPDLAASVFERHHPSPVRRTRSGISWEVVETAKTRDLETRLREIVAIDLLPRGAGLLRDRRFPDGTLVVWSGDEFPSDDDIAARDVTRVLGIEAWQWWEADGRRFYSGAPVADRDGDGHSMILVRPLQDLQRTEFATRESEMRFHLQQELHDWLPLLLLGESAVLLREQAGRLRESLARRANSRLGRLWPFGLGTLVAGLSDVQYRLERLRQAVNMDGEHRGFQQFPMMVLGRPERFASPPSRPQRTIVQRIARWLESTVAEPKPPPQPRNLRQSWLESLDLVTRTALHEVRLSFDRARLLADIRSTNVLLGLTFVLLILTGILVVRTTT
jgi:hypothetical protein